MGELAEPADALGLLAEKLARLGQDVRAIMALGLFDEDDEYFRDRVGRLGLGPTLEASRTSRHDA